MTTTAYNSSMGRTARHGPEASEPHENLMPQNVEAVASVLGSVEIDPDALGLVRDWLRADDFYRESHRLIYLAMCDLWDAGTPADLILLTDELARRGQLDDVGGASYVSSLSNQTPTSANIEGYARVVTRTATLRRLIGAAGQIAGMAYSETDAQAALDQAEALLRGVADRDGDARDGRLLLPTAPEMADAWMEAFSGRVADATATEALDGPKTLGAPTGLRALDRIIGGMERGKLVTVAARPGHGKSALALSAALNAARAGYCVGMFSLEMDAQDVMTRAIAQMSGVAHERLRRPTDVTDDEWDEIMRAYAVYRDLPFALDDARGLSVEDICARARRFVRQGMPLDVLMVDYLQIVAESSAGSGEGGGGKSRFGRTDNRQQALGQMTRALRRLARELNCCVVLMAQLSRAVEQRMEKKPQLSDLRESGDIENDSDVVLLLWRQGVHDPECDNPNTTDVYIAKNRAGATGMVTLWFDAKRVAFRGVSLIDEVGAAS